MTFNKLWFEQNKQKLEDQYLNKYVAIHNGRVVVCGETLQQTINQFVAKYGEDDVYIGYVGDEPVANAPTTTMGVII